MAENCEKKRKENIKNMPRVLNNFMGMIMMNTSQVLYKDMLPCLV